MAPITYATASLHIYLDTFILQLDGSSDIDIVNYFKTLTYLPSIITTSIMNLSGFLRKSNPVFNQQIYYYENHNGNWINSMQIYESCNNKDTIEATDCDTSRLTTASLSDYVKDTIKPTAMTVYLRYFNPTDLNLTNFLNETINKKKQLPTTIVVALLITTSPVTSITDHNTDHTNSVPILAPNDSASTTTSTDHTNKGQTQSNSTPIQVKQPALNTYFP